MKCWSEFELYRDTKEVGIENEAGSRILTGLKSKTKVILETSYQRVSDPIYDANDSGIVFGVVENLYGRCGIFSVKIPFDEHESVTIKWLPENVRSIRKLNGRIFWLYDVLQRPVWVACFRSEWEIHSIM